MRFLLRDRLGQCMLVVSCLQAISDSPFRSWIDVVGSGQKMVFRRDVRLIEDESFLIKGEKMARRGIGRSLICWLFCGVNLLFLSV